MSDVAVPDIGNYDLGDQPIPDNFLQATVDKAMTGHTRQQSQIASAQQDFGLYVNDKVASTLATNLIGNITSDKKPIDPDEDDTRIDDDDNTPNDDNTTNDNDDDDKPTIDQILINATSSHKHRESRTDFVEKKLHELFPQQDDRNDLVNNMIGTASNNDDNNNLFGGYGTGVMDMSKIASNLISFIHDDPAKDPDDNTDVTPQSAAAPIQSQPQAQVQAQTQAQVQAQVAIDDKKARGSTDLTHLQTKIENLTLSVKKLENALKTSHNENETLLNRVDALEKNNDHLIKEIQHLQKSKTDLALAANNSIDTLRSYLLQYQKPFNK